MYEMSTTALFIIPPRNVNNPRAYQQASICKLWYTYTIELYIAIIIKKK